VDEDVVEVAQRALGEDGEGGQALQAVAEELGPHRLAAGRGEDVDEAAAHRELAPLLDGVGALVAGVRQLAGERVERPLLADAQLDRGGPGGRRRQPLHEGVGRDRDEAAGGQRVQGPGPLSGEVRGRVEPGAVRGSPRRHERHRLAGQIDGRRLGQRASSVVVADQHRQAARLEAGARRPQGGDQRGQERLRGPGAGGARGGAARERREVGVLEEIRQGKLRPSQRRVGPLPRPFRHRRREWYAPARRPDGGPVPCAVCS
jgi:hypothetical protein